MIGKTYSTDVLVIGFGGAGLRAALEACKAGVDVIIAGKDTTVHGGATGHAGAEIGGFNVGDGVSDPKDNPDEHFKDIMNGAQSTANPALAKILVENAISVYDEMRRWGVPFKVKNGKPLAILGCFASRPRMHIIPGHGKPIISALTSQLDTYRPHSLQEHLIIDLIVKEGRCCGAFAITRSGEAVLIKSKAVVLAAGGAGQLFVPNLYPMDITGDGYALAYRAGATLINMEFMQAGLGIVLPGRHPSLVGSWFWDFRPKIIDERDELILYKYLPDRDAVERCYKDKKHFPFSTADMSRYIEIAVKKEQAAQKIFLDFTGVKEDEITDVEIRSLWATTKDWYRDRGIDLLQSPVEIKCVGHAVNGGVEIGSEGQTDLPGLFAAGEVAGGPHGADRLGGNMLVTCQVFGKRAGVSALRYAGGQKRIDLDEDHMSGELEKNVRFGLEADDVTHLRATLQKTMYENYLIIKNAESLTHALQKIDEINGQMKNRRLKNVDPISAWKTLELRNMVDLSRIMVMAAKYRTESRGGHFREDFPSLDPKWNCVVTCRLEKDLAAPSISTKSFI